MGRTITLLDGATGTELRARGVDVPCHVTSVWSARALIEAPDEVVGVHRDYIAAGADVVTTNNYTVTPPILARDGLAERFEELTVRAVELACRARDGGARPARVAGSMPPMETSYRADLVGDQESILADYRRLAEVLAPRVDLLLCETLSSSREAVAALTAARETGLEVWLSWTLQGNRPGLLPSGEGLAEALAAASEVGADAYLINCCGANFATAGLPVLAGSTDRPIGAYANATHVSPGEFDPSDPENVESRDLDVEAYAAEALRWIEAGATIIGGCCSTRPAHIARLSELAAGA